LIWQKQIKVYIKGLREVPACIFASLYVGIMNGIQILGLLAGSLTTAAFLPQVLKTWKSRSAKDLSLGMFSLFCLGVAMWLVYGFAVNDIPVIAANLLTLLLASTLLFFKLRFRQ
jgi:MtN3 and saliva related transmembrane protein